MQKIWIVLGLAGASLAAFAVKPQPQTPAQDASSAQFYTSQVLPILQKNCYLCHGGTTHRGGFSMTTRAALLKGGYDGVVIVPGSADKSLLIKLIKQGPNDTINGDASPMPIPPRPKLSDADIATIVKWVNAGAVMQ